MTLSVLLEVISLNPFILFPRMLSLLSHRRFMCPLGAALGRDFNSSQCTELAHVLHEF